MKTLATLAHAIEYTDFHIIDDFLNEIDYQALCELVKKTHLQGKFKPARIGQAAAVSHAPQIRNDEIYWIDEHQQDPAVAAYMSEIEAMRMYFNQALFLGLSHFEAHFAVYQPGSFYQKHIDQFATTHDRRLSCVYYLNSNWTEEDGGELQLYSRDQTLLQRISPKGNRFVCFNSELPHEVYLAKQIRYSITGWLKVRVI